MTGLFLDVLNNSISAGWLILAVLLLRLVLKRAPKWIPIVLWGMVAFRLLCPLSIENPLSLIPSRQPIPDQVSTNIHPEMQIQITPESNPVAEASGNTYSEAAVPLADNSVNIMTVLSMIWVAGVLLLVFYFVFSYWRLRRQVGAAVVLRDNIFQSERVGSPFVLGIIAPRIYLPFKIDDRNLEYVIFHEQAHIRRRDHWWKPLGFLLLSVHWFNPLMWLSYVLLCRDIELACDEKVIKNLGKRQRADYSQALLSCSISRRSIAACPVTFGEIGVKERVKSVLNYKKPGFWIIVAAVAVCVAVAVCFLTDPAQGQDALTWAQELSVEDVSNVSLTVFPEGSDGPHRYLSEDEIAAIVTLINQSKGKYVAEPEDGIEGSILFYITLQDGSTHNFQNMGNTYLVIDGNYYEAEHEWLSTWENHFAGDDLLPALYPSGQQASDSELPLPQEEISSQETVPEESTPAESIPAESIPLDTIVWENADLDMDGETETIHVREVSEGELYELDVVKKDGTVLWSAEAGTPHVGWGTILLYQNGGENYLVEYSPMIYQGMGSYSCRIITLKGGVESEENYWEADFDVSSQQTTSKMRAFAERANELMQHGTILLSTVEGELVIGPMAAEEDARIYPVRFFPESQELSSLPNDAMLEDILPLEFLFASGAGAWGTSLTLYADGHFEGIYEDSEAIAAPEYPRGTCYYCKFSGQFTDITNTSEYAYTMHLEELTYETEVDEVWIEDQRRYIGADAYGIADGEEFILYLPGTPPEELDEEFLYWSPDYYLWRDGSVNILSSYGIRNVNTGQGFFTSWLR